MFTGLIETIGQVHKVLSSEEGLFIFAQTDLNTDEIKIGDSISINGACQTVIKKEGNILVFEAMKETIRKTNFSLLKKGDFVNMERALTLNSRLDGHLVSGHIDCTSKLLNIKNEGSAKIFKFECNTYLIAEKGSISINGISLTVCGVFENSFEVSILPHTFNNTNLKYLKISDAVNIEYDMVAKYIKKFITKEKESKITEEFLIKNGF